MEQINTLIYLVQKVSSCIRPSAVAKSSKLSNLAILGHWQGTRVSLGATKISQDRLVRNCHGTTKAFWTCRSIAVGSKQSSLIAVDSLAARVTALNFAGPLYQHAMHAYRVWKVLSVVNKTKIVWKNWLHTQFNTLFIFQNYNK